MSSSLSGAGAAGAGAPQYIGNIAINIKKKSGRPRGYEARNI